MAKVRQERRFDMGMPATGKVRSFASAKTAKRTLHEDKVKSWTPGESEPIMKPGRENRKIGGRVTKGWLKGAHIYTLSLEERRFCPPSCAHRQTCYGNMMGNARRWVLDDNLIIGLGRQIEHLCRKHEMVLVRLHVLGDFATWKYLKFWCQMLDDHDNLAVFGWTAWPPDSPIGAGIVRMREALGRRFSMRHSVDMGASNAADDWMSFSIDFPTEKPTALGAMVCLEQRHANDAPEKKTCCGDCTFCWTDKGALAFIEH